MKTSNAKLLQQLKSGFKRTINWNKHQSKSELMGQNQYLNHLIDPNFQEVHRLYHLNMMHKEWGTKDIIFQM